MRFAAYQVFEHFRFGRIRSDIGLDGEYPLTFDTNDGYCSLPSVAILSVAAYGMKWPTSKPIDDAEVADQTQLIVMSYETETHSYLKSLARAVDSKPFFGKLNGPELRGLMCESKLQETGEGLRTWLEFAPKECALSVQ